MLNNRVAMKRAHAFDAHSFGGLLWNNANQHTVNSLLPMSMYHDPLSNDNMTLLLMSEKAEVERALLNATFGLG